MKMNVVPLMVLALLLLTSCGTVEINPIDLNGDQPLNISANDENPVSGEDTAVIPSDKGSEEMDCKKIAFVLNEENAADIYTVCPDGSQLTNLTNGSGLNGYPAWSPNGDRIVFSSTRDGSSQIFVMNQDGQDIEKLTSEFQNDHPIWLPNGNQIAFRTTDGEGLWWWRILDMNDSEISTFTEPSYDFFFQTPAWSPDGQYIAYMSLTEQAERNDGSSQIHVCRFDGSEDIALTSDIWANINPIWSPDGTQIAFFSERDGSYNQFALYVIGVDGSGLAKLTEPHYSESTTLTWSPDGNNIAISDNFFGGGIMIIDLRTGETRECFALEEGQSASMPAWQP